MKAQPFFGPLLGQVALLQLAVGLGQATARLSQRIQEVGKVADERQGQAVEKTPEPRRKALSPRITTGIFDVDIFEALAAFEAYGPIDGGLDPLMALEHDLAVAQKRRHERVLRVGG